MNNLEILGEEITLTYLDALRNLPKEAAIASIATIIKGYSVFMGISFDELAYILIRQNGKVEKRFDEGGDTN